MYTQAQLERVVVAFKLKDRVWLVGPFVGRDLAEEHIHEVRSKLKEQYELFLRSDILHEDFAQYMVLAYSALMSPGEDMNDWYASVYFERPMVRHKADL